MSVVSLEVSPSNPIKKSDLDNALSKLGQTLKPDEEPEYLTLLQALHETVVETVLNLPDYEPPTNETRYPRTNVHFPTPEENEYGAWAWKCTIKDTQANGGILSGKSIVLKDNISVAGVPCLLGTEIIKDWKPTADATVVTRILEAGATIIGKGVCENLSLSASSFSAGTGPVHNPYAKGYSTGGSSSGCAALLALEQVDMAMGGDQGGSIRLPANWCGLYGLKPTFGLVPYTGIALLEPTIDHTGPMARTCLDNAILLKAVAGRDDIDDRSAGAPLPADVPDYPAILQAMKNVDQPLKGFKIGLLKEGFDICDKGGMNDPRVALKVKEAADKWKALGATVEEVSVPMHTVAPTLWMCIARMGCIPVLLGGLSGRGGFYMTELGKKMENIKTAEGWEKTPWAPKNMILNGTYLWDKHPELYGKAANHIRLLRSKYNEALSQYDVLVTPTTPYLPNTHAPPEAGVLEKISRSMGQTLNTCPFNITGHPAMSMPIGMLPALEDESIRFPVGLQLVGRHWDEVSIYKAAFAWESSYNWKQF